MTESFGGGGAATSFLYARRGRRVYELGAIVDPVLSGTAARRVLAVVVRTTPGRTDPVVADRAVVIWSGESGRDDRS